MKAADVIKQLSTILPRLSNDFTTEVQVTLLSRVGSLVTAVTSTPHNLATGNSVTISGALIQNEITSLTRVGDIATAITIGPHDLTEGFQLTVNISDADQAEYNGDHKLLSVSNRTKFTFEVNDDPVTPATGTPLLNENKRGNYNGRFVVTVIDSTSFTYTIVGTPVTPAAGTILAHTEIRVSGGIDIERIITGYTKQMSGELWAFVVLDDPDISRDRSILNDANVLLTNTQARRIREIENFSIYVFIPTIDSIAGLDERDQVDDITVLLYKSLVGVKLPSNLSTPREYIVTPNGNTFFGYTKGFLYPQVSFPDGSGYTWGRYGCP